MSSLGKYARVLAFLSLGLNSSWAEELGPYPFPGAWQGAAYTDDNTGEFSSCVASAEYRSDTVFYVSVTKDYAWSIGFANKSWRLRTGGDLAISYRFDGGPWFEANAQPIDPSFFYVPMPAEETLISLFRRAQTMEIAFSEGRYLFNLTGTYKLTAALVDCVNAHAPTPRPPTAVAEATPPSAAATAAEQPKSSSGTGIIVASDGMVLTNNHVVDGCSAITVTQSGDIPRQAEVLRRDRQNDLTVLKVDTSYDAGDVAVFRQGKAGRAGETVAVYGFPLTGMLSAAGNIVAGNITALSGIEDDVRFFQISTPVQPGNSGGPLIDASGLVLGVVNARIDDMAVLGITGTVPQNVNFAIKGSVAMSFLDAHSISYQVANNAPEIGLVEIADRAKRFGVYIQCSQ